MSNDSKKSRKERLEAAKTIEFPSKTRNSNFEEPVPSCTLTLASRIQALRNPAWPFVPQPHHCPSLHDSFTALNVFLSTALPLNQHIGKNALLARLDRLLRRSPPSIGDGRWLIYQPTADSIPVPPRSIPGRIRRRLAFLRHSPCRNLCSLAMAKA
jgi:hypothetical protein